MVINAIHRPFPNEKAYLVLDKKTGAALNYRQLINNDETKDLWEERFCYEMGRLTQGYKHIAGTNTAKFLSVDEIKNIPSESTDDCSTILITIKFANCVRT